MPRFVILEHDRPDLHWDLMLESGDVLATWALPPQPFGEFRCSAKCLPDHRKCFLDYEGEVSGNRGSVRRIDAGNFQCLDKQRFLLHGTVFVGVLEFQMDSCEFHPSGTSTD